MTYSETQMLLIHGRAKGDYKMRDLEEMKAHNVGFNYMRKLAKEDRLISEVDIRSLNKIILKEPFYKITQTEGGEPTRRLIEPGKYKTQPNYVFQPDGDVFNFASPIETPSLMVELANEIYQWLKQDSVVKQKAIIAFLVKIHQQFIHIHPFDDGNGRVIRLLINYMLMRHDFLPMVLENRDEYINAIKQADFDDYNDLENLFAGKYSHVFRKRANRKTYIT